MLRHLVDMEAKAWVPFERTGELAREHLDFGVAKARVEHTLTNPRGEFSLSVRAGTVTWMSLCIPRQDQARMIVALWDEARTALLASNVTQQQRLLSGWLSGTPGRAFSATDVLPAPHPPTSARVGCGTPSVSGHCT
jgi:hypothetical protein